MQGVCNYCIICYFEMWHLFCVSFKFTHTFFEQWLMRVSTNYLVVDVVVNTIVVNLFFPCHGVLFIS